MNYEEYNKLPKNKQEKYEAHVYDERFIGGGFEDVDLFLRARDTFGMKIVMSGMSIFWHKEGATRWGDDRKSKYKALDSDNAKRFEEKWGFNYWTANVWKEKPLWER